MDIKLQKEWVCYGGQQRLYRHRSKYTCCDMEFSIFIPPGTKPLPVLVYLSGLTCNWENFTTKAGFHRAAIDHNIIIVAPDTSPRGETVPDADQYDFGKGAGFYLDATQSPWSHHYQMYSYITKDLPQAIAGIEPKADLAHLGISGHSMGGHGALTIGLKNPDQFKSISAFSPIVAPMQCPWGIHALTGYLGDNQAHWHHYDACSLIATKGWSSDILIDQGAADEFLENQLRPHLFEEICKEKQIDLKLRYHPGYDHSYYFIASFIEDHIKWHADRLSVQTPG